MRKDIEKLLKFLPEMKKRFRNARRRYRSLATRGCQYGRTVWHYEHVVATPARIIEKLKR